jgi:hypothetical protein
MCQPQVKLRLSRNCTEFLCMQGACIAQGRILVADVELPRNVWIKFLRRGKNAAGKTVDLYPSLVDIAVVYMTVHATACAPE